VTKGALISVRKCTKSIWRLEAGDLGGRDKGKGKGTDRREGGQGREGSIGKGEGRRRRRKERLGKEEKGKEGNLAPRSFLKVDVYDPNKHTPF